jgi:Ca2+-binding EF-hand superfamily protein
MNMRTKLLIGSAVLIALPLIAIAAQDAPMPPMPPEPPEPPTQMMQKMMADADTNHDGFVDKAEHRALADKRFDEADANHDGKLSPEEMQQAHRHHREMRKEHHEEAMNERMEMRFDNQDANDDGKVTFEEFSGAHKTHFDMLDANHDGFVDKDEMSKPATKVMIFRNDDGEKGQKIEKRIEKRIAMRLDALDDNHDHKVSLAEFTKGEKAHFDKMDANHDGALDMSETPKPMMWHGDHGGGHGGKWAHRQMMTGDGDMQVNCTIIEEKDASESK